MNYTGKVIEVIGDSVKIRYTKQIEAASCWGGPSSVGNVQQTKDIDVICKNDINANLGAKVMFEVSDSLKAIANLLKILPMIVSIALMLFIRYFYNNQNSFIIIIPGIIAFFASNYIVNIALSKLVKSEKFRMKIIKLI